ncbi:hypothetical protein K5D33_16850 [Pseudomonas cichorii]|nr:hypothetical protein [Pseudomonas cichorii]MBX8536371.1 hypothetical protein [Pseudomonas cichorii]
MSGFPEASLTEDIAYLDANAPPVELLTSDGAVFGKILALTGQSNLADARKVFLGNPGVRIQVILSNADSVAMLAAMLGSERFH